MNRYPVEMLDHYIKLQIVTNDHRIRGIVFLKDHIDIDRLKNAVRVSFIYVPLLRCKYIQFGGTAYWEEINCKDADFFSTSEEALIQEIIINRLVDTPLENGPQIYVHVVRSDESDVIILTANHMVFDGFGFKSYLGLLSLLYSGKSMEGLCRDRRIETLLKNIPLKQQGTALFRRTFQGNHTNILHKEDSGLKFRLSLLKVDEPAFQLVKATCREKCIKINDFFLSLFVHAIASIRKSRKEKIVVQVMFDLRRFIENRTVSAFGNFSSMESIVLPVGNKSLLELAQEISVYMNRVKSRTPGVKNIVLMKLFYNLLPRSAFDRILSNIIQSANLSISNLGIIDENEFCFDGHEITDAYIMTSIKTQPALQVSFSTFKQTVTMSILGKYTDSAWEVVENLLSVMKENLSNLKPNSLAHNASG